MSFCTKCGHSVSHSNKFCSNCGIPVVSAKSSGMQVPTYFIVSAILVVVLLGALYISPLISQKPRYDGPIVTPRDTVAAVSTHVASDGKLNFVNETYVIVTGSFEQIDNVHAEVRSLRDKGEVAGYFWRPDFPSLEGKPLYSTFIGFFDTYADCESKLRSLQQSHPDYYGLKLSRSTERVKIR